MFRRGMASLVLAGTIAFMAAPAVMADTTGGGNSNTYQAFGEFSDGQVDVQVNAFIGTQDGTAVSDLSFSSFSQQDITCKGKGKNKGAPGQIFTQYFGDTDSAAITIDSRLRTATASGTIAITKDVFNTCTGADAQTSLTTSVSLAVQATTGTTSTRSRTVTRFPDGSKEIFTDALDSRDAGGTISGLGMSFAATFGQIAHDVETDTIVPAPTRR